MNISQDFIDYIEQSGYNLYRSERAYHFSNNGKYIIIYKDGDLSFNIISEDNDLSFNIEGVTVCIYKKVNKMSLFTFALLLHAIGAVDMKENFRKTKEVTI
jgi:hypothetical protein